MPRTKRGLPLTARQRELSGRRLSKKSQHMARPFTAGAAKTRLKSYQRGNIKRRKSHK